ncbi:C-type lectin domain family 4 member M isoform X1 [Lates calcarifer]|uniref:C-type lectin domain family 4 member M isoform X1 n=1 Tax=Lates calcarifer TaxID=8187 RepID=A0AAJ8B0A0_LATCA|nr:C-type lectin domain family 4 member M isoform X1 [Lates calcarifer]
MDQRLDIYVDAETSSSKYSNRTRQMKSSENIYENALIYTLEPHSTGPAFSGADSVKKSSCRAAVLFLGLLCLLLLAGLITLGSLYTKKDMKMALLQTSYNNLTNERDQLQTSYNNLTNERDQLQISLYNLHGVLNQLQSRYDTLAREKDQLQKRLESMTKDRNDLQRGCQGWVYFGGSVYNSEEEQKFSSQWKDNIWIGLTDRETEGTWKWVDGTPLTTSYWASNEPNGHTILRDEDCGEVMLHEIKDNWNDKACDDPNFWICEKKLPL